MQQQALSGHLWASQVCFDLGPEVQHSHSNFWGFGLVFYVALLHATAGIVADISGFGFMLHVQRARRVDGSSNHGGDSCSSRHCQVTLGITGMHLG
jgi:hypothetical protein